VADLIFPFELKDLQVLKVVGHGSGGEVQKALHVPTNKIIALKVITLDVNEGIRRMIILELKTLYKTLSKYVVSFYDAFYSEGNIYIALEFMDSGSLADVLKACGSIPERILSKLTANALKGLHYLHRTLHLIHRDIKPSNLLLNSQGILKIADFGVASQRTHTMSKAETWVGTVTYMSPERISGQSHSYDSDIWSLGLTIVECALGRYPYSGESSTNKGEPMSFFELLNYIVKSPSPSLSQDKYSPELCNFVQLCLHKDPLERMTASDLLTQPFITKYANDPFDIAAWIQNLNLSM